MFTESPQRLPNAKPGSSDMHLQAYSHRTWHKVRDALTRGGGGVGGSLVRLRYSLPPSTVQGVSLCTTAAFVYCLSAVRVSVVCRVWVCMGSALTCGWSARADSHGMDLMQQDVCRWPIEWQLFLNASLEFDALF